MESSSLSSRLLQWPLFDRPRELTRVGEILAWWEKRRPLYNLAIGGVGLATLALILAGDTWAESRFKDYAYTSIPPATFFVIPVVYGIVANLCYTGGWLVEVYARRVWKARTGALGQISFFLGFWFSVLLTFLPAFLFWAALLLRHG